MIPEEFFKLNLDLCAHYEKVEGDYAECGVWRGGMSAAIAEILGNKKGIHLFDSFEGLPPAQAIDGREALTWQQDTQSPAYFDNCRSDESSVHSAMKMAGHTNYTVHKGWFNDTLPKFTSHKISVLRLDGDWYDSVIACLRYLYPKVTAGAIVVIDDYYTWDGCAKAVHDYLSETKSSDRVYQWKNQVAYIIRKSE